MAAGLPSRFHSARGPSHVVDGSSAPGRTAPIPRSSRRPGRWARGGASTLWRVVLPDLTTALLTVVLVLREFTMASLDLYPTFPVWILALDQTSGQISVAALLDALFITWSGWPSS